MHPLNATQLDQLGTNYLIAYKQARLAVPKGFPHHDASLVRDLEGVTDLRTLTDTLESQTASVKLLAPKAGSILSRAAEPLRVAAEDALDEWERVALHALSVLISGNPFAPEAPLEIQVSPAVSGLLSALVTKRRGIEKIRGRLSAVQLAVEPVAVPDRPTFGSGPIDIFEFTDLVDLICGHGHTMVTAGLGGFEDKFRWHLVHAPTGFYATSGLIAAVAELIGLADREKYWDAIRSIYRHQLLAEVGNASRVLGDVAIRFDDIRQRAQQFIEEGGLDCDIKIVNVCAVPVPRPLFAIGRKIFIGTDQAPAMRAEIEALLATGPAPSRKLEPWCH